MSRIEVRASTIEGLGIFAVEAFGPHDRIGQISIVREITEDAPLREEDGERFNHCDYPDGKIVLIGFPDRHVNHSCDPNAYVSYGEDGCWFVARRDIEPGEEITIDYAINLVGGSSWRCSCGAKRCRGSVVGDFFQLPLPLQVEYRPHLAEWFVRRHKEQLQRLDSGMASLTTEG